jgi:ferritin-like metal-binding protein YciE
MTMFETFETPKQLFTYKLGSALKMENTVLEMLDKLQEETHRDELRRQFSHHADETRQQIANVERAFEALDEQPERNMDLTIEAIDKEGRANVKRSRGDVVDLTILAGAAATEHHEIAVYEWLVSEAESLGHQDVAGLLRQNLEQEQHTLEEVRRATHELSQETAASAR